MPPEVIAEFLGLDSKPSGFDSPRYNVAPSQDVPVFRLFDNNDGKIVPMRWGLIPFWSKDASGGARMINARSETAASKPAYRGPFKRRRALVPASGFYEWKQLSEHDGSAKQPMYIHPVGRPFAFAALWDSWRPKDAPDDTPTIQSVTILTCAANELMAPIHNRMPVMIEPDDFARWLDPDITEANDLADLLVSRLWDGVETYPVSRYVNSPRNDSRRCIQSMLGSSDDHGSLLDP